MMLRKTEHLVPKELMDLAIVDPSSIDEKFVLNQPTGKFFYDPWEIKPEFKDSIWCKILKTLPYDQGEARLLVLEPGKNYFCHADIDDRWHLSISGKHSFLVDLNNNVLHKTERDSVWYSMDAGRLHSAVNFGDIPRVQLVVRQLLNRSLKDLISVSVTPINPSYDTRYKFDQLLSPWLNVESKENNIDNFQPTSTGVNFSIFKDRLDDLNLICKDEFKITILDAC